MTSSVEWKATTSFKGWGIRAVEERRLYCWELPSRRFWWRRLGDRFGVATEDPPFFSASDEKEVKVDWQPLYTRHRVDKLKISPALPNGPILLSLDEPIDLAPGASTVLFAPVPVWVQLLDDRASSSEPLRDLPTVEMAKAWFGSSTTRGVLCNFVSISNLCHKPEELECSHEVICPVRVKNGSLQTVKVSKVFLQVSSLSIFETDKGLWADETIVTFTNEGEVDEVRVTGRPPYLAQGAKAVAKPRRQEGTVRAAIMHTFDMITKIGWWS